MRCGAGALALRALKRLAGHVTWGKLPLFLVNRFMPNEADRDMTYDYVDRRARADLFSAEMWFKLAVVCGLGILLARLCRPDSGGREFCGRVDHVCLSTRPRCNLLLEQVT
jgi:hypothetical protein